MSLRDLAFLFLGGVLAVLAQGVAAPEVSLEMGQCRYGTVAEGTFYQSDLHTDNYMRPACGGVALSDKLTGSDRFGWRVGFIASGSINARDNQSTNDERAHAHVACNHMDGDGCMVRFNGEGKTFGFAFGLTADVPLTSNFILVGEGGLFFFQHHFKAQAINQECRHCTRQIAFNETSKLWDMPSPYAGVTLRWRDFYVAARHYWPSGNRALSLWNAGEMNQIVAGVVFPIGRKI